MSGTYRGLPMEELEWRGVNFNDAAGGDPLCKYITYIKQTECTAWFAAGVYERFPIKNILGRHLPH